MPNKREDDTNYWRARQARANLTPPEPLVNPSVLPSEDLADHALLVSEYYARFNPTRPEERSCVDDIIYCEWILRRLVRTETELTTFLYEDTLRTHPDFPLGQPFAAKPKVFTALQWRAISTRKALMDALDELRDLRLHPIPDPEPDPDPDPDPAPDLVTDTPQTPLPEIGFVLETHSPAPVDPPESLSICKIICEMPQPPTPPKPL